MTEKIHGIAVSHRKSGEIVEFIKCETGRSALRVLSGIRINMSHEYKADETYISEDEYKKVKEDD